jgi:cellulose biosynthesis protein BcsQ
MLKEIFDFVVGIVTDWTLDRVLILFVGAGVGALALAKIGQWMNWFASPWRIKALEREKAALERELKSTNDDLKQGEGENKNLHAMFESQREHHKLDVATWKDRVDGLTKKTSELAAEVETWHDEADKTAALRQAERAHLSVVKAAGRKLIARRNQLMEQLKLSEQRNLDILNQDGKFWERPPEDKAPPFRPFAAGGAAIIAVMNLKGGVGKTTITANLGYALAKLGYRVLMVDTDHQATLTMLCLSETQVRDARLGEGKLVNNLFKLASPLDQVAFRNLTPVSGLADCSVMATSSALIQIEEMSKARWLIRSHPQDVRYLFREAFHAPLFQSRFDVILIDCPPRLTTGCVNALTAADQLLVPTLLDHPSVDAIPLLLGWIGLLKQNGVCPNLELLGIIGNRASAKTKLSKREADLWKRLEERCRDHWDKPIRQLQMIIPQRVCFADAAEKRAFAAASEDLQPIFQALAKELLSLQVIHEHRKPASVPA